MRSEEMLEVLQKKGKPLRLFHKGDLIKGTNKMKSYSYTLSEAPGTNFAEGFTPYKTPGELLSLGVFGGKYLNDCILEFPKEWFIDAIKKGKLSPEGTDIEKNFFAIDSRLPLSEWRRLGWVPNSKRVTVRKKHADLADARKNPDERGWFQWYCRYWMGRRIDIDAIQIQRWKNFRRHFGAVQKACPAKDLTCRPRQRQALLQWAWKYDI
jgi:hypothetical protein